MGEAPLPSPSGSPDQGQTPGDAPDRVENAKQVHDQYWLVWQDQVEFAETLREKRRLYATAIALVAALGVFRLSWSRNTSEVPAIPSITVEVALKVVLALSLMILLAGAHKLYTERAYFSPRIDRRLPRWLSVFCRRCLGSLWEGRPEPGPPSDDELEPAAHSQPDDRAISELVLSREEAFEWLDMSAERIWIEKAFRVRKAHLRLRQANSRVNRRIRTGIALLGLSYGLLALVLIAYAFASTLGRIPA